MKELLIRWVLGMIFWNVVLLPCRWLFGLDPSLAEVIVIPIATMACMAAWTMDIPKRWQRPILQRPGRIKRWVYQQGYRPPAGSPLYSPSLDFTYGWKDAEDREE